MVAKKEEDDEEEETSSSSEETESETEEESETETRTPAATASAPALSNAMSNHNPPNRSESAMARTDIGPLLARSAEARRGSKEESPSTRQDYLAVDDASALQDNETNRRLESKQSKTRFIKKAAGRIAIGVLENLFG